MAAPVFVPASADAVRKRKVGKSSAAPEATTREVTDTAMEAEESAPALLALPASASITTPASEAGYAANGATTEAGTTTIALLAAP